MPPEPLPPSTLPSPAFLERFHARAAAAQDGVVRFDAFVDLALYDPVVGYYRQNRPRVGYAPGTDFYTASTSGPLFGELVSAADKAMYEIKRRRKHNDLLRATGARGA